MKIWHKVIMLALGMLILGILYILICPFFDGGGPHHTSKRQMAKLEMGGLVQAIKAYKSQYGHMPLSEAVRRAAADGDFTYGATIETPNGEMSIGTRVEGRVVLNSELIAVLLDQTNFPGEANHSTVNTNHCLNPQQTMFLNARFAGDITSPGVGSDLVYRDPWGTPYFITLDLNEDGKCHDVLYGKRTVSQMNGMHGYMGLSNTNDAAGNGNHFCFSGGVMVWSAGPDKKVNFDLPANQGENKDNVVSWQ